MIESKIRLCKIPLDSCEFDAATKGIGSVWGESPLNLEGILPNPPYNRLDIPLTLTSLV